MNYCDEKNKNEVKQENNHKSHMSHILIMVLCCSAPFIILLLLPIIGNITPGINNFILTILPFFCPIIMMLMMLMMFKGNKKKQSDIEARGN